MNKNYIQTTDGTYLYYKDWGEGLPIIFLHGWPLSSDAFEDQMLFLANQGFRTLAYDRRGHGRSSQPWEGHNMDQYAKDLADFIEQLNLKDIILVGHSTGGGVAARYLKNYGTGLTKKLVLLASVTPLLIERDDNPNGVSKTVFDDMRDQLLNNRSDFYLTFSKKFYGFNKLLTKTSEGLCQSFFMQAMQGSIKAHYDCIAAFSETDQRDDLKAIDIPTLVLYGDQDEIVPPEVSSLEAVKLLTHAQKIEISGAPHGLCSTHKDEVNQALHNFILN
ncbi:alpha/beta fold hydrolase [Acinetobacter radioresistens]|uniref:Hydrolase, alpha/beta domain protein n=1 Tax=Acinetobacter radioresistens SK82 TaxID=596318 RepID=A0ABP2GL76_ACIRA|nr:MULTISPECIES: alpha/beta hydrolase [Acinetobacter]EET82154.1 hydrolase, alpha/beta domain protein [Acinetobacter radioresistens SK82]EEY87445.1 non-heme chloroperoxidase [Acinetobacter radioresistens SH164]EXE55415.1 non-heme chloroperoxidase [Acinetobacter sp. 1239920]MCK4096583.1 alpha/beta hydrolase [Acinetobacter radioresistens]MCK4100522.1 alpha/beta hydrolase [Acinetobacter radioresistens]